MKTYPGEAALAKSFDAGRRADKVRASLPVAANGSDLRGREITLGEKPFKIPALTFAQVRELAANDRPLQVGSTAMTPEHLTALVDVMLPAFQRNYPDITAEDLEEVLDLENYSDVLLAVSGQAEMAEQMKTLAAEAVKATAGRHVNVTLNQGKQ